MAAVDRSESFKCGAALAAACLLAVACSDKAAAPGPAASGGSASQAMGGTTGGVVGNAGAPVGGSAVGGQLGTGGVAAGGQAGSGTAGSTASAGGGSGSGGASGAAGSQSGGSAGAGGTASNAGTPTMTATGYSFTLGDLVMEINTQVGARVSKLALGGTDLIMTSNPDPTKWGSVFWTSPRADWMPDQWPPPVAIDNAAYTASVSGTHVLATGMADPAQGTSMAKDYSIDPATGWINIAYTVKASKALKASPWEVSRVPRGGIVFFAVGSGTLTPGPLTLTQSAGVAWFDDAAMTATSPDGDKCYGDGAGWTAYVLGGNLFLKKFTDQPASAQATGEGEIDVYPGDGFLEFEVQGPYTSIPAAGTLPWSIQWRVAKVPSTVTVAVGSTTLVDFVQQQLAL